MGSIKDNFIRYIHQLQDTICLRLEEIDDGAVFAEDKWQREGGGGGVSRIIEGGDVFEKGGVNTSVVHGELPELMQKKLNVEQSRFFACGISLVIHPQNPMVPTVHANFRLFKMYDRESKPVDLWFGGGADLTPYYIWDEDAIHFHETLKKACDPYGAELYAKFKLECDKYFFNTHRNEPRGIGGIFFDYLRGDENHSAEEWMDFVKSCGDSFLEAYIPIVQRRMHEPWNEQNREWQELRRGRYVEFNLIHDRGTLFGLKTNARVESLLMSLPPRVRWNYNHTPAKESPEAALIEALHYKNWIKTH